MNGDTDDDPERISAACDVEHRGRERRQLPFANVQVGLLRIGLV